MTNRDELVRTVRDETDPIRRIRLAGEAMLQLQQGEVELSRLRREAIEQAAATGMTYSEVARQVDLTRGRVSQIRSDSPPRERAFFGIGPLTLAVPLRPVSEREHPIIASEDVKARDQLADLLRQLIFHIHPTEIDPRSPWIPDGDELIAICGPKSSPTIAQTLASDPHLDFCDVDGRFGITDRDSGDRLESPMDDEDSEQTDIGYFGRLAFDDHRRILLIAGVHAIGSLGVVHYLSRNVADLYSLVGNDNFSMVVSSEYKEGEILTSEATWAPVTH